MIPKLIKINGDIINPGKFLFHYTVDIDGVTIGLRMTEFRLLTLLAVQMPAYVADKDLFGFPNTAKYIYRLKQAVWQNQDLKDWQITAVGRDKLQSHYKLIAKKVEFNRENLSNLSPEFESILNQFTKVS